MNKFQKISLFILRISMGWVMFYAGITKVLNPQWSATGYLENAQSFKWFFAWLTQPELLPIVNFFNEWGLTLLGASLLLGILVRLSSILGAILMILYYLPILNFPMVGDHSLLIDDHIIYALVLVLFYAMDAGKTWGLDKHLTKYFKKND